TLGVTRNSTSSLFERVQDALADNLCHGVDVVPGDRFLAGYNPDGQAIRPKGVTQKELWHSQDEGRNQSRTGQDRACRTRHPEGHPQGNDHRQQPQRHHHKAGLPCYRDRQVGHPLPWSSGLQPTCPGCGIWDWPPPPLTNVVAYWRGFAGEPGSGAEGGLNGGVVIVLNNSPRVREVPLGKLLAGADKPTAGKPAGDKPTGEDQVAGERK